MDKPKTNESGGCNCNLCLLFVCWIIAVAILVHSLYIAITYAVGGENDILTHCTNWSVAGASLFLVIIIQYTYVSIFSEFKFGSGPVWFWILFTTTLIFCLMAFACVTASAASSSGWEDGNGGGDLIQILNGTNGRSAVVWNTTKRFTFPAPSTTTQNYNEIQTLSGSTDIPGNEPEMTEIGPTEKNDEYDDVDAARVKRDIQNNEETKENEPAIVSSVASTVVPLSGSGSPDDPFSTPLLEIYSAVIAIILTLVLRMYLYYTCLASWDKEACWEGGKDGASTTTGRNNKKRRYWVGMLTLPQTTSSEQGIEDMEQDSQMEVFQRPDWFQVPSERPTHHHPDHHDHGTIIDVGQTASMTTTKTIRRELQGTTKLETEYRLEQSSKFQRFQNFETSPSPQVREFQRSNTDIQKKAYIDLNSRRRGPIGIDEVAKPLSTIGSDLRSSHELDQTAERLQANMEGGQTPSSEQGVEELEKDSQMKVFQHPDGFQVPSELPTYHQPDPGKIDVWQTASLTTKKTIERDLQGTTKLQTEYRSEQSSKFQRFQNFENSPSPKVPEYQRSNTDIQKKAYIDLTSQRRRRGPIGIDEVAKPLSTVGSDLRSSHDLDRTTERIQANLERSHLAELTDEKPDEGKIEDPKNVQLQSQPPLGSELFSTFQLPTDSDGSLISKMERQSQKHQSILHSSQMASQQDALKESQLQPDVRDMPLYKTQYRYRMKQSSTHQRFPSTLTLSTTDDQQLESQTFRNYKAAPIPPDPSDRQSPLSEEQYSVPLQPQPPVGSDIFTKLNPSSTDSYYKFPQPNQYPFHGSQMTSHYSKEPQMQQDDASNYSLFNVAEPLSFTGSNRRSSSDRESQASGGYPTDAPTTVHRSQSPIVFPTIEKETSPSPTFQNSKPHPIPPDPSDRQRSQAQPDTPPIHEIQLDKSESKRSKTSDSIQGTEKNTGNLNDPTNTPTIYDIDSQTEDSSGIYGSRSGLEAGHTSMIQHSSGNIAKTSTLTEDNASNYSLFNVEEPLPFTGYNRRSSSEREPQASRFFQVESETSTFFDYTEEESDIGENREHEGTNLESQHLVSSGISTNLKSSTDSTQPQNPYRSSQKSTQTQQDVNAIPSHQMQYGYPTDQPTKVHRSQSPIVFPTIEEETSQSPTFQNSKPHPIPPDPSDRQRSQAQPDTPPIHEIQLDKSESTRSKTSDTIQSTEENTGNLNDSTTPTIHDIDSQTKDSSAISQYYGSRTGLEAAHTSMIRNAAGSFDVSAERSTYNPVAQEGSTERPLPENSKLSDFTEGEPGGTGKNGNSQSVPLQSQPPVESNVSSKLHSLPNSQVSELRTGIRESDWKSNSNSQDESENSKLYQLTNEEPAAGEKEERPSTQLQPTPPVGDDIFGDDLTEKEPGTGENGHSQSTPLQSQPSVESILNSKQLSQPNIQAFSHSQDPQMKQDLLDGPSNERTQLMEEPPALKRSNILPIIGEEASKSATFQVSKTSQMPLDPSNRRSTHSSQAQSDTPTIQEIQLNHNFTDSRTTHGSGISQHSDLRTGIEAVPQSQIQHDSGSMDVSPPTNVGKPATQATNYSLFTAAKPIPVIESTSRPNSEASKVQPTLNASTSPHKLQKSEESVSTSIHEQKLRDSFQNSRSTHDSGTSPVSELQIGTEAIPQSQIQHDSDPMDVSAQTSTPATQDEAEASKVQPTINASTSPHKLQKSEESVSTSIHEQKLRDSLQNSRSTHDSGTSPVSELQIGTEAVPKSEIQHESDPIDVSAQTSTYNPATQDEATNYSLFTVAKPISVIESSRPNSEASKGQPTLNASTSPHKLQKSEKPVSTSIHELKLRDSLPDSRTTHGSGTSQVSELWTRYSQTHHDSGPIDVSAQTSTYNPATQDEATNYSLFRVANPLSLLVSTEQSVREHDWKSNRYSKDESEKSNLSDFSEEPSPQTQYLMKEPPPLKRSNILPTIKEETSRSPSFQKISPIPPDLSNRRTPQAPTRSKASTSIPDSLIQQPYPIDVSGQTSNLITQDEATNYSLFSVAKPRSIAERPTQDEATNYSLFRFGNQKSIVERPTQDEAIPYNQSPIVETHKRSSDNPDSKERRHSKGESDKHRPLEYMEKPDDRGRRHSRRSQSSSEDRVRRRVSWNLDSQRSSGYDDNFNDRDSEERRKNRRHSMEPERPTDFIGYHHHRRHHHRRKSKDVEGNKVVDVTDSNEWTDEERRHRQTPHHRKSSIDKGDRRSRSPYPSS